MLLQLFAIGVMKASNIAWTAKDFVRQILHVYDQKTGAEYKTTGDALDRDLSNYSEVGLFQKLKHTCEECKLWMLSPDSGDRKDQFHYRLAMTRNQGTTGFVCNTNKMFILLEL